MIAFRQWQQKCLGSQLLSSKFKNWLETCLSFLWLVCGEIFKILLLFFNVIILMEISATVALWWLYALATWYQSTVVKIKPGNCLWDFVSILTCYHHLFVRVHCRLTFLEKLSALSLVFFMYNSLLSSCLNNSSLILLQNLRVLLYEWQRSIVKTFHFQRIWIHKRACMVKSFYPWCAVYWFRYHTSHCIASLLLISHDEISDFNGLHASDIEASLK